MALETFLEIIIYQGDDFMGNIQKNGKRNVLKKNSRSGFTIVELVIVIAVIAILAGVLIPTFAGLISKANESKALQEATSAYREAYALAASDGKITDDEEYTVGDYKFTFTGSLDDFSCEVTVKSGSDAANDKYSVTVGKNGVVSVSKVGENSVTENETWVATDANEGTN